ncbi:IclR family transcriptional regulator domain-containing protein [Propioniciclava sinopodophylli]
MRDAALGPMARLRATFEETVTLRVRTRRMVRLVAEVECSHSLRVGHRTGMVFPAHRTSGGLGMLAESDDEAVRQP